MKIITALAIMFIGVLLSALVGAGLDKLCDVQTRGCYWAVGVLGMLPVYCFLLYHYL